MTTINPHNECQERIPLDPLIAEGIPVEGVLLPDHINQLDERVGKVVTAIKDVTKSTFGACIVYGEGTEQQEEVQWLVREITSDHLRMAMKPLDIKPNSKLQHAGISSIWKGVNLVNGFEVRTVSKVSPLIFTTGDVVDGMVHCLYGRRLRGV